MSSSPMFKPYELMFADSLRGKKGQNEAQSSAVSVQTRIRQAITRSPFIFLITKSLLTLTKPLYLDKSKYELINTIRPFLIALGSGRLSRHELQAVGYSMQTMVENFKAAFNAMDNNKPIVWVEWIGNTEILGGFDVASFNPEALVIFGRDNVPVLCETAENQGTAIEHCSAIKTSIGSYLLEQIPHPTAIIAGSHPCDTSVAGYQALQYLTNAPLFTLDAPYWHDDVSYKYYEQQIWELIDFLEEHLDQKIDFEKLKKTCEQINQVNYYLRELSEMSRAIPCPVSIMALASAWVAREIDVRSPSISTMLEKTYKATKERYNAGKGIASKEKIRLMIWFPEPIYAIHILNWMQEKFGAVTVIDFIAHISNIPIDTSTNETMVRDIAKEQMNLAMARQCSGPVELMTDEFEKCLDEYSVDCMIFMGHNGCKHGWGAVKIFKDICKKRKLPSLFLSLDVMDKRHTSAEELENQIAEFFNNYGF